VASVGWEVELFPADAFILEQFLKKSNREMGSLHILQLKVDEDY
jgi:hypothetical protein